MPHGLRGARQPKPRPVRRAGFCVCSQAAIPVRMNKSELRASVRARRKLMNNPAHIAQMVQHAGDLPSGQVVALYHAIGSEMPTTALAEALQAEGRTVCLPVVVAREAPMIFRIWSPGDPLEEDISGCPAPLDLASEVLPDLIITPLVAFDAKGYRLGQGGGYYDRTLAQRPDIVRIGLAYAGQEVDTVPIEPHDIRLHGVLTENGYRATS